MALFKKSAEPEPTPQPDASAHAPGGKKSAPTPTRREAEAARRERLNPTLSPKEAKQPRRAGPDGARARHRQFAEQENTPARVLMRDHVDARFNPAEFAMPILLAIMAATLIPALLPYIQYLLYASWAYIALMLLDVVLMWRSYKAKLAATHPNTPLRGLLMYGFNRQMTFRRWRRPARASSAGRRLMFRWAPTTVHDADAGHRPGLGQEFPTQADAEAWLTASFEDLLDAGAASVTLLEGDRVVYGPMSLSA